MASRKQTSHSAEGEVTPRTRRTKALPDEPGTTIHLSPGLVVVVADKPADGGGGTGRPKIIVCKCAQTAYKCHQTPDGNTVCKEECVAWDCTDM